MRPLRYLATLDLGRRILWCYLVWYLVLVGLYFDPSPSLWLSALGVSVLIGFAFLLGLDTSPRRWAQLDRWMVARLFLIPFCVASFSALVKGRGFIVVFSPALAENALALAGCFAFLAVCRIARRIVGRQAAPI
ncbi:MAG: hypothetical protein M5U08_22580 [Burkholderiales bacterium]|nr:hypothetical protein [Burkholderiales bacterium]